MRWRRLEMNGGRVAEGPPWRFVLPPVTAGYADAQIDDYGVLQNGRSQYPWHPATRLALRARFSHPAGELQGTAGFGFWNAPFGDPTVRRPALPQAVWFFYASAPTDLPLPLHGPGRGWFASTLDAGTRQALLLAPLAPFVLLLNQSVRLRRRLWPALRQRLGIAFAPITASLDAWHRYEVAWLSTGCTFKIDDEVVLYTPHSPRGPLGFVCWIDNQYLVALRNGRLRWGHLPLRQTQWLEIDDLRLERVNLDHA